MCFIFISVSSLAEGKINPCEKETLALMSLNYDWSEMLSSMEKLPMGCFDGYFGQGISDTVVRKLGSNWTSFFAAYKKYVDNNRVNEILFNSVNETLNEEDIAKVLHLAKSQCPSEYENTCKSLFVRAKSILKNTSSTSDNAL